MKRAIALLCLLVWVLAAGVGYASENLISNGGFELQETSGRPQGWYEKAYRTQAGYSRMAVTDEQAHTGMYSVVIDNANINDARYLYTADVEPESLYRLSGYVLVEWMEDIGNGANFGIENIYAFSDCLHDTNGEWQYLEWYGETGEDQHSLTFGVRVGGYSAESTGKAYFDDISLEKVDKLPERVIASLWYDGSAISNAADVKTETKNEKSTGLFIMIGVLFVCGFALLLPLLDKQLHFTQICAVQLGCIAIALVLRLILAISVPGYQVDIGCFTAWSLRVASVGPADFYAPDYFCDYPPGAMLLLWPVGLLLQTFGNSAQLLIVKLLPIVFDMLGAWVLYGWSRKKAGDTAATVLSSLYLLNPASIVNGAAWGQVDSVLSFFITVTAVLALSRKWHAAIPWFVVSALVKPQALLFAPVGGMFLIYDLLRSDKSDRNCQWKRIAIGTGAALAAAMIIILPFSIHQEKPVGWLFALYGETLSSYAYATLNTANLYYLMGANWRALEHTVPVWLPIVTAGALLAVGTALMKQKKRAFLCDARQGNRLGVLTLAAGCVHLVLAFIGATYSVYGYAMMALVYLFVILCMYDDIQGSGLPFYMALALIGVYVLGVKVHERYLFPALLLLLISYASSRDRRVLWLFAGFSATTFINTAIVLDNAVLFGAEQGHLNSDTNLINYTLCAVNLLLCGYAAWIGVNGLHASNPLIKASSVKASEAIPEGYRKMLLQPADERLHLTFRDYGLISAITVLYAVLAFANLGSTVAPQTAWISTSSDEQVVLDLGEEKRFSFLYYAGVSYNNFSLSTSSDGIEWSDEYPCQMREGLCWQWRYATKSYTDDRGQIQFTSDSTDNVEWFTARYLRVNACESGLNLWEIVARDPNGNNLPLKLVSHIGSNPALLNEPRPAEHLIDEHEACIGEPSWFNSMYFDEIYHAREAYHNLNGEITYEWTHPPLGKLMMAAGVAIFGMTPFGWRFAGALTGVLMLPALFLFALQLTKKRSVAFVAMTAFALDLMHFTQTRIATIDSFPLLFILLSYLFMVRYMQTDLLALGEKENAKLFSKAYLSSLMLLFLSGLFMGMGIASKWTGAYSAVGLAVLFFASVWRQARASMFSYELELQGIELHDDLKKRFGNAQRFTMQRILVTCLFCVLFFVLIPCAIYVVSYLPQLLPAGPFTLERVIRTQENMLNYHSTPGLGMDHPFQSPWWQWPFILKPIWYVQDHFELAGFGATIMCLGNPWVFYIGAFAMVGVLVSFLLKYISFGKNGIALRKGNGQLTLFVIVVGFLAQYLPWMLVPRSMYIYHYFASVPFVILSTAWFIGMISNKRIRNLVIVVYLLGAIVFFVMFFPYASGVMTNVRWLDAMKWFSRLYY